MKVYSQNNIGWSNLSGGRFSHLWVQVQQTHITQEDNICFKQFTGARWLQKVLHHLWSHLYIARKKRDDGLHILWLFTQPLTNSTTWTSASSPFHWRTILYQSLARKEHGLKLSHQQPVKPRPKRTITPSSTPSTTFANLLFNLPNFPLPNFPLPPAHTMYRLMGSALDASHLCPPSHYLKTLLSSHIELPHGHDLLTVPLAWVDLSWELVQESRCNKGN